MQAFETVKQNLIDRGYQVRVFATGREAALYLDSVVDGMSVGIGGSSTIKDIGVFELLASHNTVFWHWIQEPAEARKNAMQTMVYLFVDDVFLFALRGRDRGVAIACISSFRRLVGLGSRCVRRFMGMSIVSRGEKNEATSCNVSGEKIIPQVILWNNL